MVFVATVICEKFVLYLYFPEQLFFTYTALQTYSICKILNIYKNTTNGKSEQII